MAVAVLDDTYTRFCNAVRDLCGLNLLQYRRGQMERRILTFADRRGMKDLLAYLELLRADERELDEFLDKVTINVSQLWRNPEQWAVLANEVIPELAQRGRINAWSAGCSYGAEAYTLAATCLESAPKAKVSILGWDIDRRMVHRARVGWFNEADARTAPPAQLARWFARADGGWQADERLRAVCRFEVHDLLSETPSGPLFDLVLCRNTVIYFTEDVRDALHARLATALHPGGFLLVGATERVADARGCGLEPVRPFVYRKAG
jgi:chemotaxis protein methyltransferase CheR